MRLPYLQVATEVIQQDARDLAVMLEWTEAFAGWGMLKVFNWALSRCPDDAPPSANDVIRGPMAAKLIAVVAGWERDPAQFIDGCEQLVDPPLQSVEDGVRIRGLHRYDAAWGKNNPEAWKLWKPWLEARRRGESLPRPDRSRSEPVTVPERIRSESVTEPERNSSESGPVSEHQTQTQTQTHTQIQKEKTYVRTAKQFAWIPEKPTKADDAWIGMDFWHWCQAKRFEVGFAPERFPNESEVNAWYSGLRLMGVSVQSLRLGFVAFANDAYWKSKERKPPIPFGGFVSQYDRFLPAGAIKHAS